MSQQTRNIPLDEIVLTLAKEICPEGKGFYFEAGAFDGVTASNTVRLERELGWSGILVEPAGPAFSELTRNRGANNYFVRACLVASSTKLEAEGYFAVASLTNSAHPSIMASFTRRRAGLNFREAFRIFIRNTRRRIVGNYRSRPEKSIVTVPATTISRTLQSAGAEAIDIFILDIEGLELEALNGFDFAVSPKLMVVETRAPDLRAISELLSGKGYVFIGFLTPAPPVDEKSINWHRDALWCHSNWSHLTAFLSAQTIR